MRPRTLLPLLFIVSSYVGGCSKPPYLATAKTAEEGYAECHRYTEKKKYDRANDCLELLRSRFRSSPLAILAELEVADNHFRKKDYLVAAESYQAFARLHPTYGQIDYVYYRAGLCYLKESPKAIDRDQTYLDDALHWLELARQFVDSSYRGVIEEKWTETRTRIARRHFYVGRFYYRRGEYLASIPRFEEVVINYSGLGLDPKSLYFIGRAHLKLGQKEKVLEILAVFDQHFPESPYRRRLAGKLGV